MRTGQNMSETSAPSARPAPRSWAHLLVPDADYRRHAADLARIVVASTLVAMLVVVTRNMSALEQSVGTFVEALPAWLQEVFRVLYAAGSTFIVGVMALLALVRRRWRLVLTILLTAGIAALVATSLHALFDSGSRTPPDLVDLRSFPLRRLAVSTAVLVAVRPFLVHPARRVVNAFLLIAVVGAVMTPAGLPLDVVTGFVVGWGAAGLAALAIGSPEGTPTVGDAAATVRDLGIEAEQIRVAEDQAWGEERYEIVRSDGDVLDGLVLGRDARSAQAFSKFWRALWYHDSGAELVLDRDHRIDQIGFLTLLARDRGARVPDVVTGGRGGPNDAAMLLTAKPNGTPLAEVPATEVSDELLRDLWRSVGALRGARIAHGSLDATHITVAGDEGTLTWFTKASRSASPVTLDTDLAQMLVTQAAIVGADRSVAAMRSVLGNEAIEAVLPMLQPAVLNPTIRKQTDDLKALLLELREAGAEAAGIDAPELTELKRLNIGSVVILALTLVGVWLLIGMLASVDWDEMWNALQNAMWGFVIFAAVISLLPSVTNAFASQGGLGPQLPLGGLTMLDIGGKFINVAVPATVGQVAVNVRFAQRCGLTVGAALSGGMVVSVAGFVVQIVLLLYGFAIGVVDLNLSFSVSGAEVGEIVLILVVVAIVVVAGIRGSRKLRAWFTDTVMPQIHEFRGGLTAVATSPRRLLLLFGGNLGTQLLYGLVLYSCLLAYGVTDESLMLAVVANTAATLLGGLAPVPGGIGVWEGTAIAVLTAGGVSSTDATVAVLTHRMLTYYLPPLYGYFGFAWLRRHDYL